MHISETIKTFKPGIISYAGVSILVVLYLFAMYYTWLSSYQFPAFILLGLPFLLLLVYILLFKREFFIWIFAAIIPFSINFDDIGGGFGLSVPAEPMLLMLTAVFLATNIIKPGISRKILLHPVSIGIYIYLSWLLITMILSTMPVVSAKFVLMKVLFIAGFYFFFVDFYKNPARCYTFLFIFLASLCLVILFTTYKHSLEGFSFHTKHLVPLPFYANHGIYTTTIAMLVPFSLLLILKFRSSGYFAGFMPLLILIAVILFTGMTFGHSRAAWMSLVAAAIFFIILLLKIRFSWVFTVIILLFSFILWHNEKIMMELTRINATSDEELITHTMSSANVSSDVSNLERLNRWSCALRMFNDKPVTGFGPGTYMFQYGPYQIPAEKTRISTSHSLLGDAHSEYLKALSEGGLIGFLTFLTLVILSIYTGMKVYYRETDPRRKLLALSLLLGLVSYYIHALVNNYLETDKAASLVWIFTAAIVALDIFKPFWAGSAIVSPTGKVVYMNPAELIEKHANGKIKPGV